LDIIRKGTERDRKAYLKAGKTKILELKGYKEAAKILEDQNLEMCRKAEELLTSIKEKESTSTYPVVYALLRDSTPKEDLYLVASEMLDGLEAARFGIGGALTYILHEITIRPAIQSALWEELMTLETRRSASAQRRNHGNAATAQSHLDAQPPYRAAGRSGHRRLLLAGRHRGQRVHVHSAHEPGRVPGAA